MIASTNLNVNDDVADGYPDIGSGMSMAKRRAAIARLNEDLPGFLWNEDFKARNAAKKILMRPDDLPANHCKGRASGGDDLSHYFGEAARLPLLTAEEEVFYFRRMNFVRWRAEEALNVIDQSRPALRALRQIMADLKQGDADRNLIAEHNLRLPIPLAHRFCLRTESVWDYVSEGNAALLRAIRGFDYGRGFRFSTYATWAIMNSLQRLAGKQHRDAVRFKPTEGNLFDAVEGDVESVTEEETRVSLARKRIDSLLDLLDQRSRSIMAMRYGIGTDGGPKTLKEVGEYFGVSRERVRQIEMKAMHCMMAADRQGMSLQA